MLARHLRADLAVGGEPVAGAQRVVEGEVELELARRVLMVALDHVEAHGLGVLDDAEEDGTQLLELVDVVAVGLGYASRGLAVLAALEPHHLGLGAVTHLEAVAVLELLVDEAQIAAAVGFQMTAGVLPLLPVAEASAEDPRDPLVPGKLHEGLRVRYPHQLGGLGAVADIVGVAVREEVGRRAVDELEARSAMASQWSAGTPLPTIRPVTETNW